MTQNEFIEAGFSVHETDENNNPLLDFLRASYPHAFRDNEIQLDELKTILGIHSDEQTIGYGLNFIGRNVAKAKYAQKTTKELKYRGQWIVDSGQKELSTTHYPLSTIHYPLSTENLLLKGDNLDCLKLLKSYYSGRIKCIYIDPPYNTANDEFVYPDKFDHEEQEVLGLANISETDFERMEFSFRTKKSHNGWLSFMYPRLLLARDLLAKDGVIFISIDDNEQANLKLLCDEIFGEENFLADVVWQRTYAPISMKKYFSESHEYLLTYAKNIDYFELNLLPRTGKQISDYKNPDNDPRGVWKGGNLTVGPAVEKQVYEIIGPTGKSFFPPKGYCWRFTKERFEELRNDNRIWFGADGNNSPLPKLFLTEVQNGVTPMTLWTHQEVGHNQESTRELREIFNESVFTNPKPLRYIKRIMQIGTKQNDIVLDFFAGSGTTGHAVMQLNAEDGGNRRFILCQIDEPIKEDKPAYQFCIENGLPPVISSITIERLKRAGRKIAESGEWIVDSLGNVLSIKKIKEYGCTKLQRADCMAESNGCNSYNLQNSKKITQGGDLFSQRCEDKLLCRYGYYGSDEPSTRHQQNAECPHFQTENCPLTTNHSLLDLGFKVFDTIDAPKLELVDGDIVFQNTGNDPLSRIYNMIFSVGMDNPTTTPQCILANCMYQIGANYYITCAAELDKAQNKHLLPEALKTGKVFIDGWTASINTTLQNYKEDVKIVF